MGRYGPVGGIIRYSIVRLSDRPDAKEYSRRSRQGPRHWGPRVSLYLDSLGGPSPQTLSIHVQALRDKLSPHSVQGTRPDNETCRVASRMDRLSSTASLPTRHSQPVGVLDMRRCNRTRRGPDDLLRHPEDAERRGFCAWANRLPGQFRPEGVAS